MKKREEYTEEEKETLLQVLRDNSRALTAGEVAYLLQCSAVTVYKCVPAIEIGGPGLRKSGLRRYSPALIRTLIEGGKV